MTTGNAVKQRLLWTVALVATTTDWTQAGGVGGVDLDQNPSRLFQLPQDLQKKAIKPCPQNGTVETRLLLDILSWIVDRSLCAFRHVLRFQILRVYAAILLRERMRGFSVEVLTNAAHPAI